MFDEELPIPTEDDSESVTPINVKIIKDKPIPTPYETKDAEIEDMYLSTEEIEEFENGTQR